jgi:hypothetical protein
MGINVNEYKGHTNGVSLNKFQVKSNDTSVLNWEDHTRCNIMYELFGNEFHFIASEYNTKIEAETLRMLRKAGMISSDFNDLKNIHHHILDHKILDLDESGINEIEKTLSNYDEEFEKVYLDFYRDLFNKIGFDFYFQEKPRFRVRCPGGYANYNLPKYHNDIMVGHPPQEVNVWFSICQNKTSGFRIANFENSMAWLSEDNYNTPEFLAKSLTNDQEFNRNSERYTMDIEPRTDGVFLFDSFCIHSGYPVYGETRFSMDVRIVPAHKLEEGYQWYRGPHTLPNEFKPGGIYHAKSIEKL